MTARTIAKSDGRRLSQLLGSSATLLRQHINAGSGEGVMSFAPIGPNPMEGEFAREQAREVADEAARYALRHPEDCDDEDHGHSGGGVLARVRRLFRRRT